jgi:sugar phosphate isomerase/epimerase
MEIGIFAKTFAAHGAAPVFAAVKQAGYDAAQFNMACLGLPSMPDEIPAATALGVAAAAKAHGVGISAISATYNMIDPDAAKRATGLRRLAVIAEAAAAMGTGLATLCTGTRDAADQWRFHPDNASASAWRDLLVEMEKALAIAERCNVDLGVEPELANVVSSAPLARKLIDELQSPRLKIVLDPANLFEIATDGERRALIEQAVDLLGDRIAMAHAKDRDPRGGFTAAGRGVVDFRHFVATLKRAGFDGPLVTHGLSEAEAPSVATFLREIVSA